MIEITPAIETTLAKPLHAVVGINRAGKPPQLTVVWFEWDGEVIRFSTLRNRAKFHNLTRDPAISVLVNDPDTNSYVVAYGTARLEDAGHSELARRLFAHYLPGQTTTVSDDPDRVVVALSPDRLLTGS